MSRKEVPMRSSSVVLLFAVAFACASPEPATKQDTKSTAGTPAAPAQPQTPAPSAPAAGAAAKAAPAPGSREDRLVTLRKEYGAAMNAYRDLFKNAKTPEEQDKVRETAKAPDPADWAPKFWALVEENAKDDTGYDALTWLYQNQRAAPEQKRALDAILANHITSPKMADLCDRLGADPSSPAGVLERLVAESPHRDVKGRATYALAKSKLSSAEYAKDIQKQAADSEDAKGMKEWLGEERYAALGKLDIAKANTEAEALLERVTADYADVKVRKSTLGESAKADLFEMHNLVVGKVAPDIVGEDIGAVAFKLSDYRGKVVLLDFWGNW
jgi:hypothetical protein